MRKRFVRIKNYYYAVNHVIAVKKLSKPRESSDGSIKTHIVHLSNEAAGYPQFNEIWLTTDEVQDVIKLMEEESALMTEAIRTLMEWQAKDGNRSWEIRQLQDGDVIVSISAGHLTHKWELTLENFAEARHDLLDAVARELRSRVRC